MVSAHQKLYDSSNPQDQGRFDQSRFVKTETLIHEGGIGLFLTCLMILVFLGSLRATPAVFSPSRSRSSPPSSSCISPTAPSLRALAAFEVTEDVFKDDDGVVDEAGEGEGTEDHAHLWR
jgi:hypothetical protein